MDEQILNILAKDARITVDKIAVMVGKTEKEVSEAIKGFEEKGIIKHYKAFVWQNGTMITLPGLGKDVLALGINESGWIVGKSVTGDGRYYKAVVWEPLPEPSSDAALLGGLCSVFCLAVGRSRRCRRGATT